MMGKIGAEPALFWLDGHYLPGSARGDQETPRSTTSWIRSSTPPRQGM